MRRASSALCLVALTALVALDRAAAPWWIWSALAALTTVQLLVPRWRLGTVVAASVLGAAGIAHAVPAIAATVLIVAAVGLEFGALRGGTRRLVAGSGTVVALAVVLVAAAIGGSRTEDEPASASANSNIPAPSPLDEPTRSVVPDPRIVAASDPFDASERVDVFVDPSPIQLGSPSYDDWYRLEVPPGTRIMDDESSGPSWMPWVVTALLVSAGWFAIRRLRRAPPPVLDLATGPDHPDSQDAVGWYDAVMHRLGHRRPLNEPILTHARQVSAATGDDRYARLGAIVSAHVYSGRPLPSDVLTELDLDV